MLLGIEVVYCGVLSGWKENQRAGILRRGLLEHEFWSWQLNFRDEWFTFSCQLCHCHIIDVHTECGLAAIQSSIICAQEIKEEEATLELHYGSNRSMDMQIM